MKEIELLKNYLPKGARVVFHGVHGSTSYGLNTPTSDIDLKVVYVQSDEDILSNKYVPQVHITDDYVAYEIRRFLELVVQANPNVIELLYLDPKFVNYKTKEWDELLKLRDEFLTKKAYYTFSGYANAQLKKATSTNKKYNWEKERFTRKSIIDFAKIVDKSGRNLSLTSWLKEEGYDESHIGLSKLDGFRDSYKIHIDKIKYVSDNHRFDGVIEDRNYKGFGKGNEPVVSIIEKYMQDQFEGIIYWNREAYSMHCSEVLEYEKWLKNRNKNRVAVNKAHGQEYDSKNICHLMRLVMTAKDIVEKKTLVVNRSQDREYLLSIKHGEVDLKQVLTTAESEMNGLKDKFKNSDLPEDVKLDINDLELKLRILHHLELTKKSYNN